MTGTSWEIRRCSTSRDIEWKRKKRRTSSNTERKGKRRATSSKPLRVDRLSNLPDEILSQILSQRPTKDVAAMQVLSKRMGRALSLITSVHLDDSPICHCLCPLVNRTQLVERFPLFKSFVVKVLQEVEEPITRFKLRFGMDGTEDDIIWCSAKRCFPYLESSILNTWISYPLAHRGLRELELAFRVSNPNDCKLAPQLFHFPSLESFRVNANIKIIGTDIPLICLPNLKLMHVYHVNFSGDDFLTRLVSSCPALEDLDIKGCKWDNFDRMTISSDSLRIMELDLVKLGGDCAERTELVTINTPNLQYLWFYDDLPCLYSITRMNVLIKAKLIIYDRHSVDVESSVRSQLSLLSAFTDVQHLSLHSDTLVTMFFVAELGEHLPVFRNLRTITLPTASFGDFEEWRWDIVLLLILHSLPMLESLVFPLGLFAHGYPIHGTAPDDRKEAYLEAEGWRTKTLPSCCLTHLKRIEFGCCFGINRELNMIKFFLGKATVLKELVLSWCKDFDDPLECLFYKFFFEEFVSELEELPKASNSCSIIVHR